MEGNAYITDEDLKAIDVANGGKYKVVLRQSGANGTSALTKAALDAAEHGQRLFGMFGCKTGHLPFQTADGKYDPTFSGVLKDKKATAPEVYTSADLDENPKLVDMARAALTVLSKNPKGFWLMIESGDVDWANHANNLDNSIGAVKSGDAAFRAVVEWVEENKCWDDTAVIITSDHGHYLQLVHPEAILEWPIPSAAEVEAAVKARADADKKEADKKDAEKKAADKKEAEKKAAEKKEAAKKDADKKK